MSPQSNLDLPPDAIAIIGMAGRFPGAPDVGAFWRLCLEGATSLRRFSQEELRDSFDAETRQMPNFVKARPVLEDVDLFDAAFFGIAPREAELMDPQHRLALELAWQALEDAGLDPARSKAPIGVFAGCSMSTYLLHHLMQTRAEIEALTSAYQLGEFPTILGSLGDMLATRIAYKLDLRGPAVNVQSACSTSLLAVAQACQSLQLFQCDAALAGGVSISLPQERGYLHQEGGMASRDGICRPFDAEASGTVFASGAGMVVLKRAADAIADGDSIYAIIRGVGVNNDGANKLGFTAPSVDGQAGAIMAAHAQAEVDPATIGYVECHGTATPLGDPIEFEGLRKAFGAGAARGSCVLGSAKANIGHLDAAAGVAGLIRAALALRHGEIPPLANFRAPNPRMDVENSPFRFVTARTPWPRGETPRRAGVSSFGVGGTNVHVTLEEPPSFRTADAEARSGPLAFPLSAKSAAALRQMAARLADHVEAPGAPELADVAFTMQRRRARLSHRACVTAETAAELASALRALEAPAAPARKADLIFLFPGQGSQYPGMGRGLYEAEPVYRQILDEGAALLRPMLDLDLRELLFETPAGDDDAPHPIRSTIYAQPALFLTQTALARLWLSRGVEPTAMVGHSVGELVAACLAETIAFEDALSLVAARAALMQTAEPGAMLAVRLPEDEARRLMGPDLDLAAANAPGLSVVAGPFAAVAALEARLAADGIGHRRLHTSHAFHSRMMDPVVEALRDRAETLRFAAPKRRFFSCVTGRDAADGAVGSGAYWAQHCREPVRFGQTLRAAVGENPAILLEVGPGRTLLTFAAQTLPRELVVALAPSMPEFAQRAEDRRTFASALGTLFAHGLDPQFGAGEPHRRPVSLPPYPFERKRHWVEPPARRAADPTPTGAPQPPATPVFEGPSMKPVQSVSRSLRYCEELAELIESLSGERPAAGDYATSFLELGYDSLFLGQLVQQVQKRYGLKLSFRQLQGEFPSVAALAQHMDAALPPDSAPEPAPAPKPAPAAAGDPPAPVAPGPAPFAPAAAPMAADPAQGLFAAQIAAMQQLFAQQLQTVQALSGQAAPASTPAPAPAAAPRASAPAAAAAARSAVQASAPAAPEAPSRFRMYRPGQAAAEEITPAQRRLIASVCERLAKRMPSSKAYADEHRPHLADPRTANAFRAEWKEAVFPIVFSRAKGSRVWDLDGNPYVDLINGYGQTFFGHSPDFVLEAIRRQLEDGFPIGPQAPQAGPLARRIAAMVGQERVTFCNTGSEAVMAAMRLARAVSGREKIVVFANDYHGQFDEVLVKGARPGAPPKALPIAPGIPQGAVSNMVVLGYGAAESLDWIAANADDIAAVIVEPVQSRHPELTPIAFVRELRALTAERDVALIFDEVVTGFRTHPAGAMRLFGVDADMSTYGKVIGGGMPIGVLAGKARYMDALDGGAWRFGDDSVPEVSPTFFAGTFVRHPLVLAAVEAVIARLEAEGPQLQERLAQRTAQLVSRINADLARRGLRSRAETFSSWFMLNLVPEDPLAALFYPMCRLHDVAVGEGFACFLTTAHTDEDLAQIERAFSAVLDELQSVGILKGQEAVLAPAAATTAQPPDLPDSVPLTEPQREIWLAAQAGPEASCAYNESVSVALDGPLDPDALGAALNAVIERHEALRAKFGATGETMQIAPRLTLDLAVQPMTPEALDRLRAEDARTPFDLAQGPLIRATLAQLGPQRHVLVLTAHHIVCDGFSMNVIMTELAEIYSAARESRAPRLGPVLTFRQYALDEAAKGVASGNEAYWLEQFQALPPQVDLPTDRARPPIKSYAGATYTAALDADLTAQVKRAAAKQGATLFTALFAAVQTLLSRLSGETDIVLGVPTAGQGRLEEVVLVGHCVNFLPIRAPIEAAKSFAEHLQVAKARVLDAYDHQDYTYGTLVRAVRAPRVPGRLPLTDVQFNLERIAESARFAGLSAAIAPNPKAHVNFDLFFNMIESKDGVRIDVDYATDLFDRETIARWIENLRVLLAAVAAGDERPVAALPLLSEAERAWLLAAGAGANSGAPLAQTLVDLFRQAVSRDPQASALVSVGAHMTYAELDDLSDRLAAALAARGVQPGDIVATLTPRGAETIALFLAILKCGAAYAPLDAGDAPERLARMLSELAPRLTVVDADAGVAGPALTLEALFSEAEGQAAAAAPRTPIGPEDLAYVMFTSGSTGAPKGVLAPHRAVVRLVWDQPAFEFGPDQTVLHTAPLPFDGSTYEIWGALAHGGRLAIVDGVKTSLEDIEAAITQCGVTTAFLTTGLFNALVDEKPAALAQLRAVLAGGEAFSVAHGRRALREMPSTALFNVYGPTENTVFTTVFAIRTLDDIAAGAPIGAPIARSQAYVLDAAGELAPLGAVGELYVGGDGVALGYLNRPDLTAERFVPDRFAGKGLLYRTGDIVRWRADGALDFLGRRDGQVKINGFRIELGEIEAVLAKAAGVAGVCAAVRTAQTGAKELIAFIRAEAPTEPTQAALQAAAAAHLPAHMRPKRYAFVDRFPLTANGKTDVARLLADAAAHAEAAPATAKRMPQTETERRIARVWEDVLKIAGIGADEHIFAIGGDSLHVFRIAARLTAQGLPLQARHILRHPTIGELASLADGADAAPAAANAPDIRDFTRKRRRSEA